MTFICVTNVNYFTISTHCAASDVSPNNKYIKQVTQQMFAMAPWPLRMTIINIHEFPMCILLSMHAIQHRIYIILFVCHERQAVEAVRWHKRFPNMFVPFWLDSESHDSKTHANTQNNYCSIAVSWNVIHVRPENGSCWCMCVENRFRFRLCLFECVVLRW